MDGALPPRRTVVSVSFSASNPAAAAVAAELAVLGIELTHGGTQILSWAAAYLAGGGRELADAAAGTIDDDDLDSLLDAF